MIKKAFLLCFLCFALCLGGCANKGSSSSPPNQSRVVFYFDTVVTISAYTNDSKLMDKVEKECKHYEQLLSKTVEGSDVWNINHSEGKRVKVSEETRLLIEKAIEYSRLSNGRFDITIEPCVELWDFTGENIGVLPDADELAKASEKVDWSKIDINDDGVLLPQGMSIDLGAIAKGYISDRIADFMVENGVESALLNFGGNVVAVGLKPDGSKWRIGIQDPEGIRDQSIVGVVELENSAVITSGIYERGFDVDGVHYHHILDPKTGWSVQNELAGVTIVAKEACTGDALSTTVFAMGLAEGREFIENLEGVEAVFVTKDGKVSWTSGLNERFSLVK